MVRPDVQPSQFQNIPATQKEPPARQLSLLISPNAPSSRQPARSPPSQDLPVLDISHTRADTVCSIVSGSLHFALCAKGSLVPWRGPALCLFSGLSHIPLCGHHVLCIHLATDGHWISSASQLPLGMWQLCGHSTSCTGRGRLLTSAPVSDCSMLTHPRGCKVIFVSLMASEVEHLLVCLSAVGVFSSGKCLFKSFAHF